MNKKFHFCLIMFAICLFAIPSLPSFPINSDDSESETWSLISNYLDRFMADPTTGFPLLKQIDDLSYWTIIYNRHYGKRYIRELFSTHFAIAGIDNIKLDIIFYLLKAYSSPASYELPKPIIARILEISAAKPEWFSRNLLDRKDWRVILRLMVEADVESTTGPREGLKDIPAYLDKRRGGEVVDFFSELDHEEKNELGRFEEFMKDPSGNLDRVANIYNLCATLNQYEMLHLDEKGWLQKKDNSTLILEDWIKDETTEKKIQVLFHLLKHCISPYHREELTDTAIAVLFKHPVLFVSALKNEPKWRSIISGLSNYLPDSNEHFIKTMSMLGNSDIEMKIKSQLEFLGKINDSGK